MPLNHRREGRGRESQGNEGKRAGREDGSKAGGAVASPARCQDVEPGKSGSESGLKTGIRASLRPVIIQQVYSDESRSHQKVMSRSGSKRWRTKYRCVM